MYSRPTSTTRFRPQVLLGSLSAEILSTDKTKEVTVSGHLKLFSNQPTRDAQGKFSSREITVHTAMHTSAVIIQRLRRRGNSPVRNSHPRHKKEPKMVIMAVITLSTVQPMEAHTRYKTNTTRSTRMILVIRSSI